MADILFITREQHLHMFIHCDNRLMSGVAIGRMHLNLQVLPAGFM